MSSPPLPIRPSAHRVFRRRDVDLRALPQGAMVLDVPNLCLLLRAAEDPNPATDYGYVLMVHPCADRHALAKKLEERWSAQIITSEDFEAMICELA